LSTAAEHLKCVAMEITFRKEKTLWRDIKRGAFSLLVIVCGIVLTVLASTPERFVWVAGALFWGFIITVVFAGVISDRRHSAALRKREADRVQILPPQRSGSR
jgi:hypothetical protein